MTIFQLSLPAVRRRVSPRTHRFDQAYRAFEAQQYVWVAALLDRSLLERCVLRDGIHDPALIAARWAAEICPLSSNPRTKLEAEQAAAYFLRLYTTG